MSGYIDMHCHILPEVDDGAQSIEETVRDASDCIPGRHSLHYCDTSSPPETGNGAS